MGEYCLTYRNGVEEARRQEIQRRAEAKAQKRKTGGGNLNQFEINALVLYGAANFITRIAAPIIGDVLTTRVSGNAKGLVCSERKIIACLHPGDRVRISGWKPYPNAKRQVVEATFGNDGNERDFFILDGRAGTARSGGRFNSPASSAGAVTRGT
jgi:hypothetical protein